MPDIFVYTSRGGREDNQDFVGYAESGELTVVALCDGLGEGGGLASRIVVDTVIDEPYESDDPRKWLSGRLSMADGRVKREQQRVNSPMSSTAVALRLGAHQAMWAHAGDSRLYYIHNDAIEEVTADHTVAFGKYMAGQLRRADIRFDPDRDTVLRRIGGEGELRLDFGSAQVGKGDGFVLCTDGLWANLNDQEIVFDYLKADSAERWAELLLLRAADRMRPNGDDLSVVTIIVN